jgi:hypothetical protein
MVSGTRCPFIAIINASLEAKYQNVAVVTMRGDPRQENADHPGPCHAPFYPSVKQHSGPATDKYPDYIIKE